MYDNPDTAKSYYMKVLLINPLTPERKLIHNTPNLGLGYIATALKKSAFPVDICDGMKKGMNRHALLERLKRDDYDVAGIQVYTCTIPESRETLRAIKAVNPSIITVVGGPHPSGDPEGVLQTLVDADFGLRGEGEEGFPKLLRKLSGREDCTFNDIRNLIWRSEKGVHINPHQPIQDLDTVEMPSWDLIAPHEYPDAPIGAFAKKFPLTTISCTRGCAHHCTFCANTRIMGTKLKTRSRDWILREMSLLYNHYGIKEFQIIDDCFTSDRKLAVSICEGIIESGMDISISFPNGVRIESLDKHLVQLLEKAGCYSLGMAIESGSQRIIDHMRRGQTLEMIKSSVEMVSQTTSIRMTGFFILGYPEETEEDIKKTIQIARNLPLSRANFTIWMPVPGSEMTEKLKKEGQLKDIDCSKVVINKISYVSEKLSRSQLRMLIVTAYMLFYFRPKILVGLFREIHSFEQLCFIARRIVGWIHAKY